MTAETRDVAAVDDEPAGFLAAATAGECGDVACDGRATGTAVVRTPVHATREFANATDADRPGGRLR
mgnify:CR=1 FL=1